MQRVFFYLSIVMMSFASTVVHAQNSVYPEPADLVLKEIARKGYQLPRGDYIVLAAQPVGVVEEPIVYELDAQQLSIVPGTHDESPIQRVPLSRNKVKMLRELMSIDSVRSLRQSKPEGFVLDGYSFVAIMRIGSRMQKIDRWEPDSPCRELLEALHDREIEAKWQRESQREQEERERKANE